MNSATILQNLPEWLQATVLVLGVLSTLATAIAGCFALLAKLFPRVAFFDAAAKVVAVAGLDLAEVGSWLGRFTGAKKSDVQRGFVSVRALIFLMGVGVVAVSATLLNGCDWWNNGGQTQVVTKGEQIIAEALQGKGIEQIAVDLGIDVAEALASLLTSIDTRVHATKAYAQARKVQKALASLPAPDGGQ